MYYVFKFWEVCIMYLSLKGMYYAFLGDLRFERHVLCIFLFKIWVVCIKYYVIQYLRGMCYVFFGIQCLRGMYYVFLCLRFEWYVLHAFCI